jgi:hypothetical protein
LYLPDVNRNVTRHVYLHDRPWPERPIYGTIDAYIKEIEHLERTGKELIR